jgi:signal transduction histidine kinase
MSELQKPPSSDFTFDATVGWATARSPKKAVRSAAWLLAFGIAFFLGARLSRAGLFQSSRMGLLWVPNALLVAALILAPRRSWWRILAVAGLAHVVALSAANPGWRMAWQIGGNVIFVIATVEAMRRLIGFPLRFESRREVLAYAGLVLVMPLLNSVTAPGFIRAATGVETIYSPAIAFTRFILSDVTPLLLVAPVVLLASRVQPSHIREISWRRRLEFALIMATVLAVSVIAFDSGPEIARFPWLLLLTFPPLTWAAVRLGPLGASISLVVVAAAALWGAAHQLGPFVRQNDDVVLSVQLYLIVIAPPALLLAAVIREREHVEETLLDQRNQLAQAARFATAGALSGALAHELRQPLTAILANARAARLLLVRSAAPSDVDQVLSDIEEEDRRASQVITRFRTFAREQQPQFDAVFLETTVRDALALGRSAWECARIDVEQHASPGVSRVRGDAVQLLQVILNLIVNACEAMSAVPSADRRLLVEVVQLDPAHVEVRVEDGGVGLPNDVDQLFEPLFTTKPKHLGLGLAVARSIAAAHRGRLWGENNARGGATFHLVLPADN